VEDLVTLEPRFQKFATFPTRLDFLLDHPGGGLSWAGSYGPISRFGAGLDRGLAIMERHGFPPLAVTRAMHGGHFAVLRFIELFDRRDPAERARVAACNAELCDALLEEGYVLYKTPGWAIERYRARLDPGFARLVRGVRDLVDPGRILNPGRWEV
jgi:glycolate oxidase